MPGKISNQTLKHILHDIHVDIKNLTEIATKTNGRITKLEMWRSYITGGLAVVTILLIPIVLQYVSRAVSAFFE